MLTFRSEKVTDRVTRIYAFCTELMYLVEGSRRAVLIDTGSGFGSLAAKVRELTDLPVTVLITHGHVDHAMGAAEFDDVWMNLDDAYIYGPHGEKDFRLEGAKMSKELAGMTEADYIPTAPLSHYHDLKPGDSFDLGGVHIDIYDCSGHTRGSVAMLIREERILVTGDGCNPFCFLFQDYSLSVTEYEEHLKHLKLETDGRYARVLFSHGPGKGSAAMLSEMIEVCELVKNGKSAEIPFTFKGDHGFIAKKADPASGHANLVYNSTNV